MTPVADIGPLQLGLCLFFTLLAGGASLAHGLGLGKDLLVGTIRTFAQLFLMGYVLKFIFQLNMASFVIGIFCIMVAVATHIVRGRLQQTRIPVAMPIFISMFVSYFIMSAVVTGVIVGAEPWWKPQYFIPLAGMIIGNAMTTIAISLERLFANLKTQRQEVEMHLALGATAKEASRHIVTDAIRAGMIPSINSLMGVGIVFLPGMMTGQILAGADPLLSIRYQIMVMLMLVASAAFGSVLVVHLVRNRCFGSAHELLVS